MDTARLILPWMLLWGIISVLCFVLIIRAVSSILVIGGKRCPMCKSKVFKDAKTCRFCQHKFEES